MRLGLAEALRLAPAFLESKVATFANLSEAEEVLAAAGPGDVVILDTSAWGALEGPGGAPQIQALKARGATVGLIAAAGRDAAKLLSGRGITGLLAPDADVESVIAMVEDLAAGRTHFGEIDLPPGVPARLSRLSSRQFEILELMTRGLLNKQIAWELGLTEGTVKSHVSAILDKLGCDRRTQAITAFMQCFGVSQDRAALA
jgi:DNA-binding NarL/FixJ family response regulator